MKKPVVSERYDEIVFVEPTESFAYILDKGSKASGAPSQLPGGVNHTGDDEMKEDNEDITEHKDSEAQLDAANSTNLDAQQQQVDDKVKPIDRRQFVQFLSVFPNDKQHVEKLMECLDYVKYQVSLKREELVQLEKDLLISKKQFKEADTENMPMAINYQ